MYLFIYSSIKLKGKKEKGENKGGREGNGKEGGREGGRAYLILSVP